MIGVGIHLRKTLDVHQHSLKLMQPDATSCV
jgi:hypothetical protein